MKCRQRLVEYDCHQVEEPFAFANDRQGHSHQVPIGWWVVSLPNGDKLTCSDPDFHSIYEIVGEEPQPKGEILMGFYTPNKLHVVYVFHNTSTDISYVNDAGVVVTLTKEDFNEQFHPTGPPDDSDRYIEFGEQAIEQGTKEVQAPEISGVTQAPEHDLSQPSTGDDPNEPTAGDDMQEQPTGGGPGQVPDQSER